MRSSGSVSCLFGIGSVRLQLWGWARALYWRSYRDPQAVKGNGWLRCPTDSNTVVAFRN